MITKSKLILLILTAFHSFCFSKETRTASFYIKVLPASIETHNENYLWSINGKPILTNKDTIKVNIHWPQFDTIIITKTGEKRIILTRFDVNHVYELTPLSGLNDIEIYDVEKLKIYNTFLSKIKQHNILDQDKLYIRFDSLKTVKETGKVIFKLKNYTKKELIGGTFGEMSWNFTSGIILINNKSVEISEPFTSGNSNFCFNINLGTGTKLNENDIYQDARFINFGYAEGKVFVFKENLLFN